MILVGKPIPGESWKGCNNILRYGYKDVPFQPDGWVSPSVALPMEYDLVLVKTESGKRFPAWYTGFEWDGKHIDKDFKVLLWRRWDENKNSF